MKNSMNSSMQIKYSSQKSVGAAILLSLTLIGCQSSRHSEHLTPTSFNALPGWQSDSIQEALPALKKSCKVILGKSPSSPMITGLEGTGTARDWKPFCQDLSRQPVTSSAALRGIIEQNLTPYKVSDNADSTGTFTGYYEPILSGSRRRHGRFQTPLYRSPAGKLSKSSRAQIVRGALNNKGLELVWVDDPIDAFFLQIQGSGKVRLDDGQVIRLGYAGQNGHPYFPIGRALVERGYLQSGRVSMQSIRHWLKTHPAQAEQIMSLNPSYVYFKQNRQEGPVGSHGVALTPGRSLAVDREYVSLGTPIWLDTNNPFVGKSKLQKLVVAQDTGGAIKGIVRGDLFFGSGPEAAEMAGYMNSKGEFYLLLPR